MSIQIQYQFAFSLFLSFFINVIPLKSNVRHCFSPPTFFPPVFGVYLPLMGALVWVPPGVPPQPRSHCGVMQGSLRRLFRSQASVTHSRSSSAEQADAPSNAGLADHSAANGTSTPGPTVLVTATHKGAQEDANQDEWRFFPLLILH